MTGFSFINTYTATYASFTILFMCNITSTAYAESHFILYTILVLSSIV